MQVFPSPSAFVSAQSTARSAREAARSRRLARQRHRANNSRARWGAKAIGEDKALRPAHERPRCWKVRRAFAYCCSSASFLGCDVALEAPPPRGPWRSRHVVCRE